MDIETLLEQDFTWPVRAHLVKKAVESGEEVPEKYLKPAFVFYEEKEDFFVAADLAEASGDLELRAEMLEKAATHLTTKEQRHSELMEEIKSGEDRHEKRYDYTPLQEGRGFLGGMVLVGRDGSKADFGELARKDLAERGLSFEEMHMRAIRAVLRGDLEDARVRYNRILNRAARATVGSRGVIPTGTMRWEEEASLALEIGDFERAYKIFDKHEMSHYGGILARYLGDEERAQGLFDKQIERTITKPTPKASIKGVQIGGEINWGHAALVAEIKGDVSQVIEFDARGNNDESLMKLADKRPELRGEIEPEVRAIRDKYVDKAVAVSTTVPDVGLLRSFEIWRDYGFSRIDVLKRRLTRSYRSQGGWLSHCFERKEEKIFDAELSSKIAAGISEWLGEGERAHRLRGVAYRLAERSGRLWGMAERAIELGDRDLIRSVLERMDANPKDNRTFRDSRSDLLAALGRYDEALEGIEDWKRRMILEKAERWEDLIRGVESGELTYGRGRSLSEAYEIAKEHGLTEEADRLYTEIVDSAREREADKRFGDRYAFAYLAPLIIERGDRDLAKEAVDKSRAELASSDRIIWYEPRALRKMAELAEYIGDAESQAVFARVAELSAFYSPMEDRNYDPSDGDKSSKEKVEGEFMGPIKRYEKYVKPLEQRATAA